MANEDLNQIRASFESTKALAAEQIAQLEENIALLRATGQEVEAARLEARKTAIEQYQTRPAAEVQRDTAALARENQERRQGLETELATTRELERQVGLRNAFFEAGARAQEQAYMLSRAPQGALGHEVGFASQAEIAAGLRSAGQAQVERLVALQEQQAAATAREAAEEARVNAELSRQVELRALNTERARQQAFAVGAGAASWTAPGARQALIAGPRAGTAAAAAIGGAYTADEQALRHYNVALGEYQGMSTRAALSTQSLEREMVRLGLVQAEASTEMRRHGALTTEWLGALARGETTISEFGYQIGATVGKFAGWTAAATATYGVLGAVAELGKGAIDSASGVQQLTRTIDGLDRGAAARAISQVSQNVNVPIKEASNAIFLMSRTFHGLSDATLVADKALALFKLDNVNVTDTVKAATAISQQFGLSAQQLTPIFDTLAQGQQKFNARMNDMIPLLQRSAGAVKNAGGDLNQYLQIATIALRTTQLSGSQLGTIFQRAAANFLNPATPRGQTDLATLRSLGINTNVFGPGQGGITTLFSEMIKRSGSLSNEDRQKLALAFSGTGLGGRAAALFGGGGAALQPQVAREFQPDQVQGVLQKELNRQLGTTREQLHQFINGLQRLGASLAESGVLSGFGLLLRGVNEVIHAFGDLGTAFAGLPSDVRTLAEALLAFKAASAFLTGTQFGRSVGALPGLRTVTSIVPGLSPSASRVRDLELAQGTRSAIAALDEQVAKQTAQMRAVVVQQNILNQQAVALSAELERGGLTIHQQVDLAERRVALLAEIDALNAKGNRLESELNAQQAARRQATAQLVGLTARRPSQQLSEAQKAELASTLGVEGAATTAAGQARLGEVVAQRAAAAKTRFAQVLRLDAAATGRLGAAALTAGAAAEAETIETEIATGAVGRGTTLAQGATNSMRALGTRLGDFAATLDPLTVAIFGIPLAIDIINKAKQNTERAVTQAQAALTTADALRRASHPHYDEAQPYDIRGALGGALGGASHTDAIDAINAERDQQANLARSILAARQRTAGSPIEQVGYSYQELAREAQADALAFQQHKISKQELIRRLNELKRSASASLDVQFASTNQDAANLLKNFGDLIAGPITRALAETSKSARDFYDALGKLSDKQITQQVQGYADRANVYGLAGGDLAKAGQTYLFLAARMRGSKDSTQLQLVQTAQQAFIGAVNKNVQDFLKAAESATTDRAQAGDVSQALGTITTMRGRLGQWVQAMDRKFKNYPAIIRAVQEAARQLDANLNDQLQSAVQQMLQLMQSQNAVKVSAIQGFSPEANIARARQTLVGYQAELARARAIGANAKTIDDLINQIQSQQQQILQLITDNARGILEARGQLATASITGISPQDDIARAQQNVTNARNLLAFDQAHGAGEKSILDDMAALDGSIYALNQAMQQRAAQVNQDMAAFIQAQAAYAESQTTDPVAQARDQLAADIKAISTIKPSDYRTYQEYQTALLDAKTKANRDQTAVRTAIVDQDMATLQYELHTQQISDQQYLDGLQQLLKMKKLTLQERQNINAAIFDTLHQSAVDLNVGQIKVPTTYEVRKALASGMRAAMRGAGGPRSEGATVMQSNTTNHVDVKIYVSDRSHLKGVTDALGKAIGSTEASAQAGGLI